jgi:hypothetical protein
MMPAGWWTTAGLVLSLIGVLLLIRYGVPYRVRTTSRYEMLGGWDGCWRYWERSVKLLGRS